MSKGRTTSPSYKDPMGHQQFKDRLVFAYKDNSLTLHQTLDRPKQQIHQLRNRPLLHNRLLPQETNNSSSNNNKFAIHAYQFLPT